MILESERRRDTFQGASVPIVLADGQAWCFPKPFVQLTPRIEGGKFVDSDVSTHFGAEFDAMTATLAEADAIAASMVFPIAVFLLRWNYDLTDAELSGLLVFRLGDDESTERFEAILAVAQGNAPKASAAGAGSQP
jgi:hypothetical protein